MILDLGLSGLKKYIKTIGLYNTKATNILKTCKILVEEHNGEVPEDRESLERLPGVGRKTANVILNTAFGQPTIAVDTHIFRVSNRTGIAPGKDVVEVEKALIEVCPGQFSNKMHIIGLFYMGVILARLARLHVMYVRYMNIANGRKKNNTPQ